ncbi:unnamed protein product [Amoebophrya sp. A25]|nr:unnamed protein product [Amoebophrya sp. A25]|eukprot:GSA25T00002465001.1
MRAGAGNEDHTASESEERATDVGDVVSTKISESSRRTPSIFKPASRTGGGGNKSASRSAYNIIRSRSRRAASASVASSVDGQTRSFASSAGALTSSRHLHGSIAASAVASRAARRRKKFAQQGGTNGTSASLVSLEYVEPLEITPIPRDRQSSTALDAGGDHAQQRSSLHYNNQQPLHQSKKSMPPSEVDQDHKDHLQHSSTTPAVMSEMEDRVLRPKEQPDVEILQEQKPQYQHQSSTGASILQSARFQSTLQQAILGLGILRYDDEEIYEDVLEEPAEFAQTNPPNDKDDMKLQHLDVEAVVERTTSKTEERQQEHLVLAAATSTSTGSGKAQHDSDLLSSPLPLEHQNGEEQTYGFVAEPLSLTAVAKLDEASAGFVSPLATTSLFGGVSASSSVNGGGSTPRKSQGAGNGTPRLAPAERARARRRVQGSDLSRDFQARSVFQRDTWIRTSSVSSAASDDGISYHHKKNSLGRMPTSESVRLSNSFRDFPASDSPFLTATPSIDSPLERSLTVGAEQQEEQEQGSSSMFNRSSSSKAGGADEDGQPQGTEGISERNSFFDEYRSPHTWHGTTSRAQPPRTGLAALFEDEVDSALGCSGSHAAEQKFEYEDGGAGAGGRRSRRGSKGTSPGDGDASPGGVLDLQEIRGRKIIKKGDTDNSLEVSSMQELKTSASSSSTSRNSVQNSSAGKDSPPTPRENLHQPAHGEKKAVLANPLLTMGAAAGGNANAASNSNNMQASNDPNETTAFSAGQDYPLVLERVPGLTPSVLYDCAVVEPASKREPFPAEVELSLQNTLRRLDADPRVGFITGEDGMMASLQRAAHKVTKKPACMSPLLMLPVYSRCYRPGSVFLICTVGLEGEDTYLNLSDLAERSGFAESRFRDLFRVERFEDILSDHVTEMTKLMADGEAEVGHATSSKGGLDAVLAMCKQSTEDAETMTFRRIAGRIASQFRNTSKSLLATSTTTTGGVAGGAVALKTDSATRRPPPPSPSSYNKLPRLGGIFVECAEMSTYSDRLREIFKIPVWDMVSLSHALMLGYLDNPLFGRIGWQTRHPHAIEDLPSAVVPLDEDADGGADEAADAAESKDKPHEEASGVVYPPAEVLETTQVEERSTSPAAVEPGSSTSRPRDNSCTQEEVVTSVVHVIQNASKWSLTGSEAEAGFAESAARGDMCVLPEDDRAGERARKEQVLALIAYLKKCKEQRERNYLELQGGGEAGTGDAQDAKKKKVVFGLGCIRIDSLYKTAPGDVADPRSHEFPIVNRVVPGLTFERCRAGMPTLPAFVRRNFINAIRYLDRDPSVALITGDCGFMMAFQELAQAYSRKPVLMSSLMLITGLNQFIHPDRQIAIFTANGGDLEPLIPVVSRVCGMGLRAFECFNEDLYHDLQDRTYLDSDAGSTSIAAETTQQDEGFRFHDHRNLHLPPTELSSSPRSGAGGRGEREPQPGVGKHHLFLSAGGYSFHPQRPANLQHDAQEQDYHVDGGRCTHQSEAGDHEDEVEDDAASASATESEASTSLLTGSRRVRAAKRRHSRGGSIGGKKVASSVPGSRSGSVDESSEHLQAAQLQQAINAGPFGATPGGIAPGVIVTTTTSPTGEAKDATSTKIGGRDLSPVLPAAAARSAESLEQDGVDSPADEEHRLLELILDENQPVGAQDVFGTAATGKMRTLRDLQDEQFDVAHTHRAVGEQPQHKLHEDHDDSSECYENYSLELDPFAMVLITSTKKPLKKNHKQKNEEMSMMRVAATDLRTDRDDEDSAPDEDEDTFAFDPKVAAMCNQVMTAYMLAQGEVGGNIPGILMTNASSHEQVSRTHEQVSPPPGKTSATTIRDGADATEDAARGSTGTVEDEALFQKTLSVTSREERTLARVYSQELAGGEVGEDFNKTDEPGEVEQMDTVQAVVLSKNVVTGTTRGTIAARTSTRNIKPTHLPVPSASFNHHAMTSSELQSWLVETLVQKCDAKPHEATSMLLLGEHGGAGSPPGSTALNTASTSSSSASSCATQNVHLDALSLSHPGAASTHLPAITEDAVLEEVPQDEALGTTSEHLHHTQSSQLFLPNKSGSPSPHYSPALFGAGAAPGVVGVTHLTSPLDLALSDLSPVPLKDHHEVDALGVAEKGDISDLPGGETHSPHSPTQDDNLDGSVKTMMTREEEEDAVPVRGDAISGGGKDNNYSIKNVKAPSSTTLFPPAGGEQQQAPGGAQSTDYEEYYHILNVGEQRGHHNRTNQHVLDNSRHDLAVADRTHAGAGGNKLPRDPGGDHQEAENTEVLITVSYWGCLTQAPTLQQQQDHSNDNLQSQQAKDATSQEGLPAQITSNLLRTTKNKSFDQLSQSHPIVPNTESQLRMLEHCDQPLQHKMIRGGSDAGYASTSELDNMLIRTKMSLSSLAPGDLQHGEDATTGGFGASSRYDLDPLEDVHGDRDADEHHVQSMMKQHPRYVEVELTPVEQPDGGEEHITQTATGVDEDAQLHPRHASTSAKRATSSVAGGPSSPIPGASAGPPVVSVVQQSTALVPGTELETASGGGAFPGPDEVIATTDLLAAPEVAHIDRQRFVVMGVEDLPAFEGISLGLPLDFEACEMVMLKKAAKLVELHPDIDCFLLECTQLPMFSDSLRATFPGRPVYDVVTACHMLMLGFLTAPKSEEDIYNYQKLTNGKNNQTEEQQKALIDGAGDARTGHHEVEHQGYIFGMELSAEERREVAEFEPYRHLFAEAGVPL